MDYFQDREEKLQLYQPIERTFDFREYLPLEPFAKPPDKKPKLIKKVKKKNKRTIAIKS